MRLEASFPSLGELGRSLMTNLSQGGLFIACENRVDIGTHMTLRLHLDDPGDVIEVPVEVVAHDTGPQLRGGVRGMGIRFLDDLYERAQREAATL